LSDPGTISDKTLMSELRFNDNLRGLRFKQNLKQAKSWQSQAE